MDIQFTYSKKRRELGKRCAFTDIGPHLIVDIEPDENQKKAYYLGATMDREIDNTTKWCAHEVNTKCFPTESRGMNHTEGGWPSGVDTEDEDSMIRFRKKFDKDKNYVNKVKSMAEFAENFVMENKSIDVYEEYFKGQVLRSETEYPFSILNVFKDQMTGRRKIVDVAWDNDNKRFAAAYVGVGDEEHLIISNSSFIWDAENCIDPICTLEPEVAMTCIEFSPFDSNLILAGYISGQVSIFDIRVSGLSQQASPVFKSHALAVTGVKWLRTKHGMDFFSGSIDGQILSWTAKDLSAPISTISLDPSNEESLSIKEKYTISCVEYDPSVPHQFMVGTEQGKILRFNRMYKSHEEDMFTYDSLYGPILRVERNEFFPDLFASCDTWAAKIWSETVTDSPILTLNSEDGFYTDLRWSPSRASMLYLAKSTGCVEMWDIPGKTKKPLDCIKLENEAILCVRLNSTGNHMACSTDTGTTYLLNVPQKYITVSDEEMELVGSCIRGRETLPTGKPRKERFGELEDLFDSEGEEDFEPVEKAEDLYEEHQELFDDFIPEETEKAEFNA